MACPGPCTGASHELMHTQALACAPLCHIDSTITSRRMIFITFLLLNARCQRRAPTQGFNPHISDPEPGLWLGRSRRRSLSRGRRRSPSRGRSRQGGLTIDEETKDLFLFGLK